MGVIAQRRAPAANPRGFRDPRHFRAIIFLLGGNLHFDLPDPFPNPFNLA